MNERDLIDGAEFYEKLTRLKIWPSISHFSPDELTIYTLTHQELEMVPADLFKWICCVEGCDHFTRVKSFATFPLVYWRHEWLDIRREIYFCGHHWKTIGRKFEPTFDPETGEHCTVGLKRGWGFWHVEPKMKTASIGMSDAEWADFIEKKRNPTFSS
jgi:hypothetical protein